MVFKDPNLAHLEALCVYISLLYLWSNSMQKIIDVVSTETMEDELDSHRIFVIVIFLRFQGHFRC